MSRSRPARPSNIPSRGRGGSRGGLTLLEVAVAASLTALLASSLAAMTLATRAADDRLARIATAQTESVVACDRIRSSISRAGVYQNTGEPTTLGVQQLTQSGYYISWASMLICWTGGREGDLSSDPVRNGLPVASEVLVYADPLDGSGQFCEIAFPGDATPIDFRTITASQIRTLIDGPTAEIAPLCESLVRYDEASPDFGSGTTLTPRTAVFFDLRYTPATPRITAATTATAWSELPWLYGQHDATSGLRNCQIDIELQFAGLGSATDQSTTWPMFDSFSRTFRYEK